MAHGTLFWRPDSDDDNEDDVKLHTERFAYRNKLGSGGFGAVWRVRDRWLKQDFALKVSRTPMMQEVNVLRNMPRDYFINTFDYTRETGVHGYLMELMEPPWITLHEYFESFKRNAPRPRRPEVLVSMRRVKAALQVHIQLLTALSHLHGQRWGRVGRWCHADVKPMNTWVNSDVLASNIMQWGSSGLPFVKIGDLGLVTSRRGTFGGGTPLYESPEQRDWGTPSPACDVYAAGQTLMYMITGSPLCSNQLVSIGRITAAVEDHVPSRHLSKQIARLVRRMTYTAPNQRPWSSDAAQLASDIISDDREWIVLELFAGAPPSEGLLLNDAADTLFNKFAEREHWLNRTDARFKTIQQLLKDMYHAGKLIRRGHRYFLT